MNQKKKGSVAFKIAKRIIMFFYPKYKIEGAENLPDEPCIIVSNHAQIHGPLACEFYMPEKRYTWCEWEMMNLKEVPAYVFKDFWSEKPKGVRWFFKIMSYIIAPLSVFIFNNAYTIPVYHDARLLTTFKLTISNLKQGNNVVIFPEHNVKCNHIIYDFQDKFIDIAKSYHKKTGKEVSFVPMYIAPKLKTLYLGKAIKFCPENPMKEERAKICEYLKSQITEIAVSCPEHKVVPYRNISKRRYLLNTKKEATEK